MDDEEIKKCLDMLDDTVDFLADLEHELKDEQKDELTVVGLHDLYDMAEDVSESARIERAEFMLARRHAEESL